MFGCSDRKEPQTSAAIEGDPISLESIDSLIHDKLYEHLYDIYSSRRIALNLLLTKELLNKEAVNRNLAVDSLLKLEVDAKATPAALSELIADNNLQEGIRDPKNFNRLIDAQSPEGQEYLYGVLKRKLERDFIAQLKAKYKTEIFLKPPLPPRTDTKEIVKYPLNEAGKSIDILWISDFNCMACRTEYPLLKDLMRKYRDRVTFYHVPFSNSVTREMIYFDCVSRSVKEVERPYSLMFESQTDSVDIKLNLMALGVDRFQIFACMNKNKLNITHKLESSFSVLIDKKISQTPAVIIDSRIYYGPIDAENLSSYIETIVSGE